MFQSLASRSRCIGLDADALGLLDGSIPTPGGWSSFVMVVEDLDSVVSKLEADGVIFKSGIVENQGRKQILCADPSGNVIEFQQPA